MTHRLPARALVVGGVTAGAAALVLALGGAGADAQKTARTYSVTLSEFTITGKRAVSAGRVTFVARNTGQAPHELVVIRTTRRAADLAAGGGKASEKGAVGEIEEFRGRAAKRRTLTLGKGHYALICNVGGHYGAGMHKDLTVR